MLSYVRMSVRRSVGPERTRVAAVGQRLAEVVAAADEGEGQLLVQEELLALTPTRGGRWAQRELDRAAVEPYPFDRLYGSWRRSSVPADAQGAVRRSAERYIARVGGGAS